MRKLLFRVWDPNTDRMLETNVGIDRIHLYDFDGDGITEQEGLVIMQFTGLHDDSDEVNEIYEGHILRVSYEDQVVLCKVVIDSGGTLLVSNNFDDGYLWAHELLENDGRIEWIEGSEIIGNIYQNAELLEATQ